MQRARALESNQQSAQDRGAEQSAPRSTPLTLVSGAVAGDDLRSVAAAASAALGLPVVIAIPTLGEPVVSARDSLTPEAAGAVVAHAQEMIGGDPPALPQMIAEAVPVRIGEQVVGIVAALVVAGADRQVPEQRAWLEAAAAAATFTSLIADSQAGSPEASPIGLLRDLCTGAAARRAGRVLPRPPPGRRPPGRPCSPPPAGWATTWGAELSRSAPGSGPAPARPPRPNWTPTGGLYSPIWEMAEDRKSTRLNSSHA